MKHNRMSDKRRSNIDRRQNIDHRYEEPEFHHLIDRRTNKERRNGDRRKGSSAGKKVSDESKQK